MRSSRELRRSPWASLPRLAGGAGAAETSAKDRNPPKWDSSWATCAPFGRPGQLSAGAGQQWLAGRLPLSAQLALPWHRPNFTRSTVRSLCSGRLRNTKGRQLIDFVPGMNYSGSNNEAAAAAALLAGERVEAEAGRAGCARSGPRSGGRSAQVQTQAHRLSD